MNWITDRLGTAAMMREMDRKAIEEYKIPGIVLMENAGRGAFEFILDEFAPSRVTVLAGKGNNGGDGYVIARHLMNHGVSVETILLAGKDDIKGDARANLDALANMGAPVYQARDIAALDDLRFQVMKSDLIVDAILGTGLENEVRGFYRSAIMFINGMAEENDHIRVFSVDLPSGLNADNGQVMGEAVRADATVTFGLAKTGQLIFPGAELAGTLAAVDISIPRDLYAGIPYRLFTMELGRSLLPARSEDAHKGTVGHGLVLAGSPGKSGAAVMAAESALRAGAGLVTLAGPAQLAGVFETKTLEVMTEALPDEDSGSLGLASVDLALALMDGKDGVAIGPGLGQAGSVRDFVAAMVENCEVPMVIDADGLNALAQDTGVLRRKSAPAILTPHPGEMARLLGAETSDVKADRLGSALKLARDLDVVCVLKGAYTITALPDGRAIFNPSGNPGMATGGTGDVLTGAILGLLCQGLEAEHAAVLGAFLHGMAGDIAAEALGEEGVIASDLTRSLPLAMKALSESEGLGDQGWPAGE